MIDEKTTTKPARNTSHSDVSGGKYIEAVGRRKTSTERVRIWEASKTSFIVNGLDAKDYFKTNRNFDTLKTSEFVRKAYNL